MERQDSGKEIVRKLENLIKVLKVKAKGQRRKAPQSPKANSKAGKALF